MEEALQRRACLWPGSDGPGRWSCRTSGSCRPAHRPARKSITWLLGFGFVDRWRPCTRSIRPLLPWVPLFQASMPSSTASLWWMANTGPSTRTVSSGSVTTTAISMMRSRHRASGRSSRGRSRSGSGRCCAQRDVIRGTARMVMGLSGLPRFGSGVIVFQHYTSGLRLHGTENPRLSPVIALEPTCFRDRRAGRLPAGASSGSPAGRCPACGAMHRRRCPPRLTRHGALAAHQRAADYTVVRRPGCTRPADRGLWHRRDAGGLDAAGRARCPEPACCVTASSHARLGRRWPTSSRCSAAFFARRRPDRPAGLEWLPDLQASSSASASTA